MGFGSVERNVNVQKFGWIQAETEVTESRRSLRLRIREREKEREKERERKRGRKRERERERERKRIHFQPSNGCLLVSG